MRKCTESILALVIGLVLATPRTEAFTLDSFVHDPIFLLQQKSVRKDLDLTAVQDKMIAEMLRRLNSAFIKVLELCDEKARKQELQFAEELTKKVMGMLSKGQANRLTQIAVQAKGFFGKGFFGNPAVVKKLKLTIEQKEKLKKVELEVEEEFRRAAKAGGCPEGIARMLCASRKNGTDKALKLLTTEQRKKWEELTGKPFKGELLLP